MTTRIEKDSLGELEVPVEALYGIQTERAIRNFPISGIRPHLAFVWSTVLIKKAAAITHKATGRLDAERADEDPMVFTKIHMHFIVTGRGLNADKVERAISLSADKYCSASAMMAKTADVTHDFEVVESA